MSDKEMEILQIKYIKKVKRDKQLKEVIAQIVVPDAAF